MGMESVLEKTCGRRPPLDWRSKEVVADVFAAPGLFGALFEE